MADNLRETTSYWNWRLGWTVNLTYTDLFNVTPVDVPYQNIGRIKSFFLETRWAYKENYMTRIAPLTIDNEEEDDYHISDVKLIWDKDCKEENGKLWCCYINEKHTYKKILYYDVKDWQLQIKDFPHARIYKYPIDKCTDEKLHVIDYVVDEITRADTDLHFYQENIVDNGVTTQGLLGIEELDKDWWFDSIRSSNKIKSIYDYMTEYGISVWDYVLVHWADHLEDSGSCGQVRQILWVTEDRKNFIMSSSWLGLKTPEENTSSRKGFWIQISFYKRWDEAITFASQNGLHLVSESTDSTSNYTVKTLCDYWISSVERETVDMEVYNNRVAVLYSTWYVVYGLTWYNLFYFTTDNTNYVGKDKIGLTSRRNILLVMWKKRIDVGIWNADTNSLQIYTQTTNVGIHNKNCYWEYEWSICFISSENVPRLLSIKIANTAGNQMLEYEEISWYLRNKLDKIRDDEDTYLSTNDNDIRVYIVGRTMLHSTYKDMTRIYFYDKEHQIWYEHQVYSIIRWNYKNFYYGSGIIVYRKYDESGDIDTEDIWYRFCPADVCWSTRAQAHYPKIVSKINWYITENEYENGQVTSDWWPLDLFRIIKPKNINLVLGTWLYTDNTKLKITNYRGWYATEQVIDNWETNKWIKMINRVSMSSEPESTECIDDDVSDASKYVDNCDSWVTLGDVEWQRLVELGTQQRDNWLQRIRVNDVNLCVDRWRYNYSNVYPLHINLNEVQKPSELVKVEIVAEEWDSFSFGWAIMELSVYPLDYVWADNEYTLDFDEDCPKKMLKPTKGCFRTK